MPLHLLGKKSWNVYNPGNIERVRQDEAEAKRLEEEREAQHRDDQAEERLRLLRGEGPLTRQPESQTESFSARRNKNKRKLPGEDDTDRDLRLALSTQSTQSTSTTRTRVKNDDPIVDSKGNISLIPVPESSTSHKKPRLDEDPYAVYLSHAAGRGKNNNKEKPWYSDPDAVSRPSWGDDSPRRTDREAARVSANDPLAVMKKGVKRLREAEKHRTEWMEQRERDLQEVEELARLKRRRDKEERHRRKHEIEVEDDVPDDLDNFNLDEGYAKPQALENEHAIRHKHRHHHRHRRHQHENRDSSRRA